MRKSVSGWQQSATSNNSSRTQNGPLFIQCILLCIYIFFFSYFSSPSIYHSERLERSWKINRILCVCFHLLLTHIFQCRCHSTGIRKNYSIITALLQRIAGAVVSLRYTQHTTHTRYTIQIECSV